MIIAVLGVVYLRKKKLTVELSISEEDKVRFQKELTEYKSDAKELFQKLKEKQSEELNTKDEPQKVSSSSYTIILDEITDQIGGTRSYEKLLEKSKNIDESFLLSLKQKYPNLSKGEIRLCVYLLMGMTSKDIAGIVNIEPASVDRRRYRLRKKVGLNANESLMHFLEEIEQKGLLE